MGSQTSAYDFVTGITTKPNQPVTDSDGKCVPCIEVHKRIDEIENVKEALRQSCAEIMYQHQGPGSGLVPPR